jgi:hypothetical protein
MKYLLRVITLFYLILSGLPYGYSQEWNYARLSVLYGGMIPFNFNTMDQLKNGIEITDGTVLGITLVDSSQVGHDLEGFDLNFRSFNGQPGIQGDVYSLDLNRIRIQAVNAVGLGAGISTGYRDLSTGWTNLFSYSNPVWSDLDWSNHQLSISYECGKPVAAGGNGSLLGEPADYYTVEIEFELIPTGPGF